jgi:hypothetical protein
MTMDLEALRRAVESEIEAYEYSVPPGTVGSPFSADRIAVELAAMRSALVAPYWAEVDSRDTLEQISSDTGPRLNCAVVADDDSGSVLVFDPMQNDFLIAVRHNGGLRSIGVRGDAVGCFIAR